MYIAIANAIYSSGAEGGGGGKVPLTDATFQQAVNDALAEEPVTGLFDVVPYGMMPDWDVSQVTIMSDAFDSAEFFNGDISAWDVSSVTDMDYMFASANSFNQNISTWNTISATNMAGMFVEATAFNQDISSWDVSSVEDMASMFEETQAFNQNINSWDVSSVEITEYMFAEATVFNQPLDSWDVSSVTDMNNMFADSPLFNQSLNSWDVSSVEDMNGMFFNAEAFDGDISAWDVSSVEDMNQMFSGNNFGTNTIFNRDISAWDVSNVTNMRQMFYKNIAFNQNLSLWGITQVANFIDFMPDVTLSTPNYDALLIGWDAQGAMSYSGTVDFGNSQYTSGGAAEAARTSLIAKWGGIIDGGAVPVPVPVPVPYTTNLVASYSFDTDFSDYTGNNPLTANGNATAGVTGGKVSDCAELDGSDDYTVAADSSDFSFTNNANDLPFSFSFWANFDTVPGLNALVVPFSKTTYEGIEYIFSYVNGELYMNLYSQSLQNVSISAKFSFLPVVGDWNHIAITYDGSSVFSGIKPYINSVSIPTTSNNEGSYLYMVDTPSSLNIGSQGWIPTEGEFDGKLDEFHIWKNRELTQSEVTDIYNTENAGNSILP